MKASGFGGEDTLRGYIAKYSHCGRWGEGADAGWVWAGGAERGSIAATGERFVGGGASPEVTKRRGVEGGGRGNAATPADLDACASAQGVEVRTGDCVILRTGLLGQRRGEVGGYCGGPPPGWWAHPAPGAGGPQVAAPAPRTRGCGGRPHEMQQLPPRRHVA